MGKFNVGDKVRVITNPVPHGWYSMNDFTTTHVMTKAMIAMAGQAVTISSVTPYGYMVRGWNDCYWTDEMFSGFATEPREFIVIRRDGSDVIASYKRGDEIVKTAKAKCAPSDEFNFDTGAKLAFDRLVGREEPSACKYGKISLSGRCVIGPYQCIREKCKAHRDYKEPAAPAPKFKVGDRVVHLYIGAGKVSAINPNYRGQESCRVAFDNGSIHDCFFTELSPAPEPKYYSGKVIMYSSQGCGACEGFYGGKIFEFINGRCDDEAFSGCLPYKSFDDFQCRMHSKSWAEVKE